jgi:hypothetical protein
MPRVRRTRMIFKPNLSPHPHLFFFFYFFFLIFVFFQESRAGKRSGVRN